MQILHYHKNLPTDKYSQNVTDLYPQLDRDNFDDNPPAAKSFAKRFPLGDVVTNDLKRSITRENTDMFLDTFGVGFKISSVSGTSPAETLTFDRQHNLNRLVNYNAPSGGSGHVDGTYRNVKLFNNASSLLLLFGMVQPLMLLLVVVLLLLHLL